MIRVVTAFVNTVVLPVLDVDFANAAHQQFELVLVEHLYHVERHKLIEAGQKRVHLWQDAIHKSPLNDKTAKKIISAHLKARKHKSLLDIFGLVLVADSNLATVLLKIALMHFPKQIFVDAKPN